MKMVDNDLKLKLENLAKKQIETTKGILMYENDPNGLNGVTELSRKMFDRATDNKLRFNKDRTGSWIAGQFMPLQLITQRNLMVDLTNDELCKQKPLNIPINSLITLAKMGFVYLNIRDFDLDNSNDTLLNGVAADNLNILFDSVSDRLYIGSSLRKPLFDALISWQGYKYSYETYRNSFVERVNASAEALKETNLQNANSHFRGEPQSLVAASWHYAYLMSIRSKIGIDIINGNEVRKGIEDKILNAEVKGAAWIKNKVDFIKKEQATFAFFDLARELRTFHLMYSAPITGSWGCTYNRTQDEFMNTTKLASEYLIPNITESQPYQELMYALLNKEGYIVNSTYNEMSCLNPEFHFERRDIDESFVDSLITSLIQNEHIYTKLQDISRELNTIYENEDFDYNHSKKLFHKYNDVSEEHTNKILGFLRKKDISIETYLTLPLGPLMIKMSIKESKLPETIKKVFVPRKEDQLIFKLHNILNER
jgi:hypothetical protein